MILDETVKFKINGAKIKYYKDLGYDIPYNNAEVEIKIEDLSEGSNIEVNCECDICHKNIKISYLSYLRNIKKYDYCTCRKCSYIKMVESFSKSCGKDNPEGKKIMNDKRKQTIFKNYGVDHPMKSEEIKTKIKETCLEKYGVENPLKNDIIKEKIENTKLEKYGDKHYTNLEKKKITDKEKYGTTHHFASEDVKTKIKKTMLEKYGVENSSQYIETKNKKIKTSLSKYGTEYGFQNEKIIIKCKKTKLEKYGDENYNNPNKNKQTSLKKYGVENPTQNEEVFKKMQISALRMKKFENLHYQGTYELDFLTKYYNQDLKNGPTIRFNFENENKIYFSDFYYEPLNLIIEIKSEYYYNKYLSKNLAKQKACLEQGYDFIFVINKDYSEFDKKLKKASN